MQATMLDGKIVAQQVQNNIKNYIIENKLDNKITLAVILVGNDPASKIYIKNKNTACEYVGIKVENFYLSENTTSEQLIKLINKLNNNNAIHGILLQLPLPTSMTQKNNINHINISILDKITPNKDVDGFNPYNIGRLAQKFPHIRPCTPKGIIKLLEYYNINIQAQNITIVGASNIVGKPLALEMLMAGGTVTICHKLTKNLQQHCQQADILCTAVGKPDLITKEFIKPGATVIDIGITQLENNKICGDVNFNEAKKIANYITPVPGGVGPMTVAMLLENTVECYKLAQQ